MTARLDMPPNGHGKGAQTAKGRRRRELILSIAARLFAERGFGNVSINDIGFEAGVTGPAIYRYFPSKEALLVSIYGHLYTTSSEGIERATSSAVSPAELVEGLIDLQIGIAREQAEAIRIVDSEWEHLPEKEAAVLRAENRRQLKVWIEALKQARPDLDEGAVEVTVHGILALLNSISLRRRDKPLLDAQVDRLRSMALYGVFGDAANAGPKALDRRRWRD